MSDLKDIQVNIQAARSRYREQLEADYVIEQQLYALQQRLQQASDQPASVRNQLSREAQALEEELKAGRQQSSTLREQLTEAYEALYEMGPVQEIVGQLDDGFPVLLMPLKIETRFITVKHYVTDLKPGDIFDLSQIEEKHHPDSLKDAKAMEVPGYSGFPSADTPMEDAAENAQFNQQVVDIIKAGQFVPTDGKWIRRVEDKEELWVRIYPDDLFQHAHEELLTEGEVNAGKAYWVVYWEAGRGNGTNPGPSGGNGADPKLAAWRRLSGQFGPSRSKWILRATQPQNFRKEATDFSETPAFPELPTKVASWTQAPRTYTLPDRFVVRLQKGEETKEYSGAPIDYSLMLGLDPSDQDEDLYTLAGEGLKLPEGLQWVSDFDKAEQAGMAVRIPLEETDQEGFDQLIVLGVKLSADAETGGKLLEELLFNHQFRDAGLAILPQGTDTNNISKKQAADQPENLEEAAYAQWADGRELPASKEDPGEQVDGRFLIDALGISEEVLEQALHRDREDIQEALATNRLLWPATMGYYLTQFIAPLVSEKDIRETRNFFTRYISGRGLLPCLRLNKQPYGLLPATALSAWKYSEAEAESFPARLFDRVLQYLNKEWEAMSSKVLTADQFSKDTDTLQEDLTGGLMKLLGLHAGSVEYYVRTMVDYFFEEDVMKMSLDRENKYWENMEALKGMGFSFDRFEEPSRLFEMLFSTGTKQFEGPVIDSPALSEKRKIQVLEGAETSYLEWLSQAGIQEVKDGPPVSFDQNNGVPLFYLLVRQALLRSYIDAGIALLKKAGIVSPVAQMDFEREETVGEDQPGAYHEFRLKTALTREKQRFIKVKVKQLYKTFKAGGVNPISIASFDHDLSQAFDSFELDDYNRQTVKEAIIKLRERLARIIPREAKEGEPSYAATQKEKTENVADFVYDVEEVIQAQVEKEYENIENNVLFEPDKWKLLTEPHEAIDPGKTLLEHIEDQLAGDTPAELLPLKELRSALSYLKDLPTARLERLMSEHIDLCNYRLDAWMLGLLFHRLHQQRARANYEKGIYIGAYGYLEQVKRGKIPGLNVRKMASYPLVELDENLPKLDQLIIPMLDLPAFSAANINSERLLGKSYLYLGSSEDSHMIFDDESEEVIARAATDKVGEGFIHTPSLAHATTAALLRSGYASYRQANESGDRLDPYAINLSSNRVRKALFFLEGIRNGQELEALLGYQFERAIYDYADRPSADESFVSEAMGYLLALRGHFPMQGSVLQATNGQDPKEMSSVFQVIDGQLLLKNYQEAKEADTQTADGWLSGILEDCPEGHRKILLEELERLEESMDALSDLLMAESVYQITKGNVDRSAAALRVLNSAGVLQEAEVVKTPRTGFVYQQRLGITVDCREVDPNAWGATTSPRAIARPHLNQWLKDQLPGPSRIIVRIHPEGQRSKKWKLSELFLQPIDLIHLLTQEDYTLPDSQLSILIREQFRDAEQLDLDTIIEIDYKYQPPPRSNQFALFQLMSLINTLANLLQSARPLLPEDFSLSSEIGQGQPGGSLILDRPAAVLKAFIDEDVEYSLTRLLGRVRESRTKLVSRSARQNGSGGDQQRFDELYFSLLAAANLNIPAAIPKCSRENSPGNENLLVSQADEVIKILTYKLDRVRIVLAQPPAGAQPVDLLEHYTELGRQLFGRSFKFFPEFQLDQPDRVASALNRDGAGLFGENNEYALEEWLIGLSRVKESAKAYSHLAALREALGVRHRDRQLHVIQLPDGPHPWIGNHPPQEGMVNGDVLSLAMELPPRFRPNRPMLGMVLEEWQEFIPHENTTTGLTFNYNQPNTEAPQTMLLAISPQQTGNWRWEDLMDSVVETMALAKKRAVDPDIIRKSKNRLAHFLPTVLAPINDRKDSPLVPSVDFAKKQKQQANG